ncbi:C-X-C chemokine receptor type 1 [Anguilla rostrata]|uniref:C-X-C chemokine receptor type 1 n=1 Tax=Anguilla rostrata TaxID=7938 RepID=UPI0030D3C7D8
MGEPNTPFYVLDFESFYEETFNVTLDDSTVYEMNEKTLVCADAALPTVVRVVMSCFYVHIFLVALPGNLVVGLVVRSCKQSLSPSDVYLFHLAVADTLLALTLPFWAASLVWGWVFNSTLCKLVSLVREVNFYSSILFLVCISVDRYLVIVRAMETRRERRRLWSWVVCGAVWAAGAVLSLPVLYYEVFVPEGGKQAVCMENHDPENARALRLVTRLLRHTLGFLLPLAAMLGCYCVTVARLLRTRGFQKQRAMRVIVAVVAAFLLCWTPYHAAAMADTLMRARVVGYGCAARQAVDLALSATQSLGLLHCCVNPVLYAFIGEKFRRNLLHLCRRKGGLERRSASRYSRSTSQTSEAISPVM